MAGLKGMTSWKLAHNLFCLFLVKRLIDNKTVSKAENRCLTCQLESLACEPRKKGGKRGEPMWTRRSF